MRDSTGPLPLQHRKDWIVSKHLNSDKTQLRWGIFYDDSANQAPCAVLLLKIGPRNSQHVEHSEHGQNAPCGTEPTMSAVEAYKAHYLNYNHSKT